MKPIAEKRSFQSLVKSNVFILLVMIVILFVVFSTSTRGFLTARNIFTILRSMSIISVLGLGISFVITAGEIDLSIGTLPALVGAIVAYLLNTGMALYLVLPIALIAAVIVGFINGIVVSKVSVPSIIMTLATYMICQGLAYIITNQSPIVVDDALYLSLFGNNVFGFPVIVLWMIGLGILCYFLMHQTRFGKNLAFLGDGRKAAYYAGINTNFTMVVSFIICAVFSFFAGVLGVAQTSSATPWMITQDMMTAIAATLIGGTSLAGGEGNIPGTLIGAFFLMMISNGILILGIDQWVLYLINGVIILVALVIGHYSKEHN